MKNENKYNANVMVLEKERIFEDNGLYDVNKLILMKADQTTVNFELSLLVQDLLSYPIVNIERAKTLNLDAPIMVYDSPYVGWMIVDGRHRTQKALDLNIKTLPAYIITAEDLEEVKI